MIQLYYMNYTNIEFDHPDHINNRADCDIEPSEPLTETHLLLSLQQPVLYREKVK